MTACESLEQALSFSNRVSGGVVWLNKFDQIRRRAGNVETPAALRVTHQATATGHRLVHGTTGILVPVCFFGQARYQALVLHQEECNSVEDVLFLVKRIPKTRSTKKERPHETKKRQR